MEELEKADLNENLPRKKKGFIGFVKTVAAFMGSGFICWLIDYGLLNGLNALFGLYASRHGGVFLFSGFDTKLAAIIIARTVSSTVNYFLNRRVVFRSGNKVSMLLYFLTVVALLGLNYGLIVLLTGWEIPLWIAQIIAQIIVYPISFFFQKLVVFGQKKHEKRTESNIDGTD